MISVTLQTQAYIVSPDRQSVLLMHRNKFADDVHLGKYLGLGGHVEPDEDVFTCVKREVWEESGLVVEAATLRGTVMWTGFGKHRRDLFCFMFRVDSFSGQPHEGNDEGTLEWVPIGDLREKPMWDSDHEWLPMIFDEDPRQFHGVMPYAGHEMLGWAYQRL
jgi:8-oxo-dGTP diphosphatase